MGKMEEAMRSEIARLTSKEIRATCIPLARDVRQLKRTVAHLSRVVASLEKLGGELKEKKLAQKAKLEADPAEVEAARFSAGLIRKLRKRLGLTQAQLASLVGVSGATVTFWEQGRNRPTEANKASLVALRKLGRRDVKALLEAGEG